MSTSIEPTYPSIWSNLAQLSFRQDWIDASGVRTRVVQAGSPSAPAVILLHGIASSWEGFCANLKPLSENFHVIAMDELGCGFTDKPEVDYTLEAYGAHVRDVMDALGVARAHLVGVSMGSLISSRFAITYPDRVGKIVMASAMAGKRPENKDDFAGAIEEMRRGRDRAVADPTWENVSPVIDQLIHDPAKRIPDLVAIRQATYRQPGMLGIVRRIMEMTDAAFYNRTALSDEEWTKIAAPLLVITSDQDADFYKAAAEKIRSLVPGGRISEFAGVGHWPQFEDPDHFNTVVRDFLLEA